MEAHLETLRQTELRALDDHRRGISNPTATSAGPQQPQTAGNTAAKAPSKPPTHPPTVTGGALPAGRAVSAGKSSADGWSPPREDIPIAPRRRVQIYTKAEAKDAPGSLPPPMIVPINPRQNGSRKFSIGRNSQSQPRGGSQARKTSIDRGQSSNPGGAQLPPPPNLRYSSYPTEVT